MPIALAVFSIKSLKEPGRLCNVIIACDAVKANVRFASYSDKFM